MASSVELVRHSDGAIVGAIRNENGSGAMSEQVASCKFAHLACANQINALAVQVTENLLGQFDGDGSDRDGRRTDSSFCANALGYGEGASEQLIELGPDGAHRARRCVGFFYLSQNLGLAHNHRVKAGGHAEDVPNRILFTIFVEMLFEFGGIKLEIVFKKSAEIRGAVLNVGDQFHSIAGGDDHALIDAWMLRQPFARFGQTRLRNCETLPDLDGCAFVVESDELESHEVTNL